MHDSSEFSANPTRRFLCMIPLVCQRLCLCKYDDICLPTFFIFFTLQNQSFPSQKGAVFTLPLHTRTTAGTKNQSTKVS
jgi:hypothetical protein